MIVLGSRRKLLYLMLQACFPAALMALLSWQIHEVLTGPWQRLFAGGFAYLVCLALSVGMLMPGVYIAAFARVRGRL